MVKYHQEEEYEEEYCVFNLNNTNSEIASMKLTKEVLVIVRNEEIDIGTTDVPDLNTFQISEHQTDVIVYYLIEQWYISLSQYTRTIKNNIQKFLCSTILLLSSRYRTDRVFTRKTLQGQWSCDTMNVRCTSMDGN